jgi:hypothetical protein
MIKWGTCYNCGGYAYVEIDEPEPGCDDLTFAEHEQGAQEALDRGDQCALLYFMSFCFHQQRAVPPWALKRFCDAVTKAWEFEIKSWDCRPSALVG